MIYMYKERETERVCVCVRECNIMLLTVFAGQFKYDQSIVIIPFIIAIVIVVVVIIIIIIIIIIIVIIVVVVIIIILIIIIIIIITIVFVCFFFCFGKIAFIPVFFIKTYCLYYVARLSQYCLTYQIQQ
uniref:Uncharacterized protein n=1 Tax=Octopus bimaculoides TaxID=37653 RepID=A0A0L8FY85_OCTBM